MVLKYMYFDSFVDLPASVAIGWGGEPNAGNLVNLTCTATNGRPTPNIRWIINGVDLSASAILETNSVTASGEFSVSF